MAEGDLYDLCRGDCVLVTTGDTSLLLREVGGVLCPSAGDLTLYDLSVGE